MKSRWLGAALLAAGLGVGTAKGQPAPYLPTPIGAARIPEPYPISEPLPPMMPGPLNSSTLPPGPPDNLSLPAGHSSAFQDEVFEPEQAIFFHFGALALTRTNLNSTLVAVQDPILGGADTGIVSGGTPIIDLQDVSQHTQGGVSGTLGYIFNNSSSIEVTGKYLFSHDTSKKFTDPGAIDAIFFNPPAGFGGDNGLWLQADQLSVQLEYQLASGEVNYRYTSPGLTELELIVGVRYIDFREKFDIVTDDDGFLTGPDPLNVADYGVNTRNQIVAPQIGFEYDRLLYKFLSFGVTAKAGAGVDFSTTNHRLIRGDGLTGFDVQENSISYFSQIYEVNAFVETHLTERCRIRAGYDLLWLVDIKVAEDQLDYNLANPPGQENRHGTALFQGPTLEFQLLF